MVDDVRYNVPNKFTLGKYGEVIRMQGDSGTDIVYFIQINKDEENPIWERSGNFFEKIFNNKINDSQLLKSWLILRNQ